MTRIGVLGAGKIGEALLAGLLASGRSADDLVFTERHPERAAELTSRLGVESVDVATAAKRSDMVVVAVKPQDIAPVLTELAPVLRPGTLVVSLCAGLPTGLFETLPMSMDEAKFGHLVDSVHSALPDAYAFMRGSSATGVKWATGEPFDEASDIDLAVVDADLFAKAQDLGLKLRGANSRTLHGRDDIGAGALREGAAW